MILTKSQIVAGSIVHNARPNGWRDTTYDATVGEIILDGVQIKQDHFTLRPRGIVWLISNEEFHLPLNVTGLATLKTGWTHDGILALNVGVVDPGWQGPLATTLINFSNKPFVIEKNAPFLRIIFHQHADSDCDDRRESKSNYIIKILNQSTNFSKTFLNIETLSEEVVNKINSSAFIGNRLSRWTLFASFIAIIVAFFSTMTPIAYGICQDWVSKKVELTKLQADFEKVRQKLDAHDKAIEEEKSYHKKSFKNSPSPP